LLIQYEGKKAGSGGLKPLYLYLLNAAGKLPFFSENPMGDVCMVVIVSPLV